MFYFQPITSGDQCTINNAENTRCSYLHSCQSCVTHTGCYWNTNPELSLCAPITNLTISYDNKVGCFFNSPLFENKKDRIVMF